jgi:hypothetical protein
MMKELIPPPTSETVADGGLGEPFDNGEDDSANSAVGRQRRPLGVSSDFHGGNSDLNATRP